MYFDKLILAVLIFMLTGTALAQTEPTTLPTPVLLIEEPTKPEGGQKKTDEEMEKVHAPALPGEEEEKSILRIHVLNNWYQLNWSRPPQMPALYRRW